MPTIDNQSFTDKFLTTLGLKNPFAAQYGINYSERSPLVVPPTRDLPPPEAAGPPPTPNWPKDPDVGQAQGREGRRQDRTPSRRRGAANPTAPCGRTSSMSVEWQHEIEACCDIRSEYPPLPTAPRRASSAWTRSQEGRIRDVHRRAGAGEPDRSAGRLSDAVAGSALWHRQTRAKYKIPTARRRAWSRRATGAAGARKGSVCRGRIPNLPRNV